MAFPTNVIGPIRPGAHTTPKINRKCLINASTRIQFKPLENQGFVFDYENMIKRSGHTWELKGTHKHKEHVQISISKHFVRYNGRYSIYCFVITYYTANGYVSLANEFHLSEAISNALKLLTFQVLY